MSLLSRLAKLEQRAQEAGPHMPMLIFLRYEGDDGEGNVLFRVKSEGSTGTLYTQAELDAIDWPKGVVTVIERVTTSAEADV